MDKACRKTKNAPFCFRSNTKKTDGRRTAKKPSVKRNNCALVLRAASTFLQ
jgi:hypothetical protein